MLKLRSITSFLLFLMLLTGPDLVLAQHGHDTPSHDMGGMKTQDVLVEGMLVSFSVMANADHLKMLKDMKMDPTIEAGTTHNITVVLKNQQTQQVVTDAAVSMRIVDPSGKDQIKPLKFEASMNSYDAYFNMTAKGKYQILILVKQGDQKKTAGIFYTVQ